MAASLLHFVAFGASALAVEPRLRTKRWVLAVLFALTVIVLSNSSTGYIGLAVLAVLLAIQRPAVAIKWGLLAGASLVALTMAVPSFQEALWEATLGKSETSSFVDRMGGAIGGWEIFLANPVIGAGWGSAPTTSVITMLLGNTGILGTVLFFGCLASTLLACRHARKSYFSDDHWKLASYAVGVENALIVSMACAVSSGLKFVVLDDWWLWGLGIGIASRSLVAGDSGPVHDAEDYDAQAAA
jgi:hypothetical protein